jgi:hypothetical protein
MFKRFRYLFLSVILIGYAFLYMATSVQEPCEGDCLKVENFNTAIRKNRPYIFSSYRCSYQSVSDSLCVYVKDTSGVDWNLLADTACQVATQNGLPQQKIFILQVNASTTFIDTVVRKQCP